MELLCFGAELKKTEGIMDYKETLKEVESFMEKTEIREFCTNFCKGVCCLRCYTSENSCKGEERRLSCSVWLCNDIRDILKPELDAYYRIMKSVEKELEKAGQNGDVFYTRPSNKVKDRFFFPKEELFTNPEKIAAIRYKVNSLMGLCRKHTEGVYRGVRVLRDEMANKERSIL